MKRRLLPYLLLISLLSTASAKEFQVNTRSVYDQTSPDIAMDANGDFVAVWISHFKDGNSNDIVGRLFDSNASPIGDEFRINTTQLGSQEEPSVAADAAGNFVVAWQGPGITEEDIFARRFEPNGQPLGAEFLVNTNTAGRQLHPRVAVSKTGAFVIVWEHYEFFAPFDAWDICGRLYDCNGFPVGSEFTANLVYQCRYPDVAMDGYGNFAIVWTQDDSWHSYNLIMARQYNADGTPKANPFEVSTGEFYTISHPSIAMDGTGHFIVTWEAAPSSAELNDIHARRYHFNGLPLCEQFRVNVTTAGMQRYPKAAINSKRQFVIVWDSNTPGSGEGNILGRRFDSSSNPIGDEFQVNTYVVGDQEYPVVAIEETGEFVAAWQSCGQDGSGYGIFADIGPAMPCADFTGDWIVNFGDYCILAEEWLKDQNPLKTDLVDDNKIDQRDLAAFCGRWLKTCYDCSEVDIYTDGKIDFKDYCLWAQGYLQQGPLKGDVTSNGTVDLADLKALALHWAKTCPPLARSRLKADPPRQAEGETGEQ